MILRIGNNGYNIYHLMTPEGFAIELGKAHKQKYFIFAIISRPVITTQTSVKNLNCYS